MLMVLVLSSTPGVPPSAAGARQADGPYTPSQVAAAAAAARARQDHYHLSLIYMPTSTG